MSKAFSLCLCSFLLYVCSAQEPRLATWNLGDGADLTFRVEMLRMDTPCLSTLLGILFVQIDGDESLVMWRPEGNSGEVLAKCFDRNLLNELRIFEVEINNARWNDSGYQIRFDGPVEPRRYGCCDPKVCENWVLGL